MLKSTKHTLEPFPTINIHEITKNMYYNRLSTKNYTITRLTGSISRRLRLTKKKYAGTKRLAQIRLASEYKSKTLVHFYKKFEKNEDIPTPLTNQPYQ